MAQKSDEVRRPLFEGTKMGAPNASIRILVAMSILKEGFGCSDEDLFEKCGFDLLARKALGLEMLDDKLPSRDTYYLFGRRLTAYEQETGINLMERCFEQVTGEQIRIFKISGSSVRMDSKLIGSNIAQYSRYEMIHSVFHDQYVVEKGKVELRDKHKVSSDSLQSPDDPDATYRDKDGQKVSGYVTDITKTVEEDKPSLITSVQTEPVTFADRGLFRHCLQAFHRCMWMNLRRLVLFQTTTNQRPLPEPASSLTGKVWNRTYRLIEAISDPMKVFREYLTLLAEVPVFSVSKLRFYVSQRILNLKATF